jgi:hypothetical protein
MSDLRKAAQELIATSESCDIDRGTGSWAPDDAWSALVDALEDALAQPEPVEVRQGWEYMREKGLLQEPVAYLWQHSETGRTRIIEKDQVWTASNPWKRVGPLYLHPPQRKPLTDELIDVLARAMVKGDRSVNWLCRVIEAQHGIE